MRDVQVLAQIRLNLTSIEQFTAIACGLADDNPSVKEGIYEAAKEARSSSLLIDHLRNLFSHQQSIELQQQQQQQQVSGSIGHNILQSYSGDPQALDSDEEQLFRRQVLSEQRQPQEQTGYESAANRGICGDLQIRAQIRQQARYFTYSNQLTLVRAAKCLVANVAKILYLTDTIVLQQTTGAKTGTGNEAQEKLHPARCGDGVDNVANYSQLLRSFGELSAELVDLGHCIMSSEFHRQQQQWTGSRGSAAGRLSHCDSMIFRRQLDGHYQPQDSAAFTCANHQMRPSASSSSLLPLGRLPLQPPTQLQPKLPAATCWRASPALAAGDNGLGDDCQLQLDNFENHNINLATGGRSRRELTEELDNEELVAMRLATSGAHWPKQENHQLSSKIQDMQTLFQVNRLTIDRSILLLLSASKCCLRPGDECLRGLEARRSIVAQIRASVSIIMAVVKCSIFGTGSGSRSSMDGCRAEGLSTSQAANRLFPSSTLAAACLSPPPNSVQPQGSRLLAANDHSRLVNLSATLSAGGSQLTQPINSTTCQWTAGGGIRRPLASEAPLFAEPAASSQRTAQCGRRRQQPPRPLASCAGSGWRPDSSVAAGSDNNNNIFSGPKQQQSDSNNNQFDYYSHYLASLNSDADVVGGCSSLRAPNSSGLNISPATQLSTYRLAATSAELDQMGRPIPKSTGPQQQPATFTTTSRSNQIDPLQIMNYFLQTWSGTQSAHDAISRLQLILRPFTLVGDYKSLIGTLNETYATFNKLNGPSSSNNDQKSPHGGKQQEPPSCLTDPVVSVLDELVDDVIGEREEEEDEEEDGQEEVDENGSPINHQSQGEFMDHENATDLLMGSRDPFLNTGNTNSGLEYDTATSEDKENRRSISKDQQQNYKNRPFLLMNKRQLISALNRMFLGDFRTNLIERAHEFTDCPYTKHEHRESIVPLIQCTGLQLNQLVKLLYKLRRRATAINELNLGQLRLAASRLDDTCAELKYQLQTIVIEQSDELDKCNGQLDLIKQLKHHCLVGDLVRSSRTNANFHEQAEQLVEVCKMLNQVSPTNKMKITTKSLAIWFELNITQLLAVAQCLARNPRSRVLKDCTWAYLQVWCSFYDDFCQLARQLAYLSHKSHYDAERAQRVASLRDRLLSRGHHFEPAQGQGQLSDATSGGHFSELTSDFRPFASPSWSASSHLRGARCRGQHLVEREQPAGSGAGLAHATSVQSLQLPEELQLSDAPTDSPRSLDHYYGFGANYLNNGGGRQELGEHLANAGLRHHSTRSGVAMPLSRQSASPRLQRHSGGGCYAMQQRSPSGGVDFVPATSGQSSYGLEGGGSSGGGSFAPPNQMVAPMQQSVTSSSSLHLNQLPASCSGDCWPVEGSHADVQQHSRRHHHYRQPQQQYDNYDQQQAAAGEWATQPFGQQQPPPTSGQPVEAAAVASRQRSGHHRSHHRRSRHSRASRSQLPTASVATGSGHMAGAGTSAISGPSASSPIAEEAEVGGDGDLPGYVTTTSGAEGQQAAAINGDADKWSDSDADAIVRGAKETAQMALSMYQFTKGEGDLNTTQDLFTQAELFAEEANELYKEVRCFSYKVPAGDLKKELLSQLGTIPALVQQLQFIVKNPTVGKPATFAKVDSVIRETKSLMEAVNRVVTATLACRQHYNMAIASMRKRTRTLSPSYRGDKGSFEFENHSSARQSGMGRHGSGGGMGSEPDI